MSVQPKNGDYVVKGDGANSFSVSRVGSTGPSMSFRGNQLGAEDYARRMALLSGTSAFRKSPDGYEQL